MVSGELTCYAAKLLNEESVSLKELIELALSALSSRDAKDPRD